ncbi:MAG: hypothetical protein ACJASL_000543 [Paraglaciecola sp.]|jgi:hypothetical protein
MKSYILPLAWCAGSLQTLYLMMQYVVCIVYSHQFNPQPHC